MIKPVNGHELAALMQRQFNGQDALPLQKYVGYDTLKTWVQGQKYRHSTGGGNLKTKVNPRSHLKVSRDGKVSGYLVLYSTAFDPDLQGEYFTKNTNFGNLTDVNILYQHGLDPTLGKRIIGKGSLSKRDLGVWIDAQLALRDDYEIAILALAEKGALGWSSGAAPHLIEKKPGRIATEITQWLFAEGSLTPTPAEPRTIAY